MLKNKKQKGIGTVDLLIYMVMAGILGTVLVNSLSGSKQNARIAVAKDFFQEKVYTSLLSCIARKGDLQSCDKSEIVKYNSFTAEQENTPWGDPWLVASDKTRLTVQYPLGSVDASERKLVSDAILDVISKSSIGATGTYSAANFTALKATSGDYNNAPDGLTKAAEDLFVVYLQK